jgi:hypothetical protein
MDRIAARHRLIVHPVQLNRLAANAGKSGLLCPLRILDPPPAFTSQGKA